VKYYAFVPQGRKYAEVLSNKEQGKRSTDAPTGVIYQSFKDAEAGVFAKNLAISQQRYGR
jgi:hypothetical protein